MRSERSIGSQPPSRKSWFPWVCAGTWNAPMDATVTPYETLEYLGQANWLLRY